MTSESDGTTLGIIDAKVYQKAAKDLESHPTSTAIPQ